MRQTLVKFPAIVAEALAKADAALAGEVYQAIMAYALNGVEAADLSAAASAIYHLAIQYVRPGADKPSPKCKARPAVRPKAAPKPVVPAAPVEKPQESPKPVPPKPAPVPVFETEVFYSSPRVKRLLCPEAMPGLMAPTVGCRPSSLRGYTDPALWDGHSDVRRSRSPMCRPEPSGHR